MFSHHNLYLRAILQQMKAVPITKRECACVWQIEKFLFTLNVVENIVIFISPIHIVVMLTPSCCRGNDNKCWH